MLKITGLDKLNRELEQAQKAFGKINGELGSVNFNPHDPVSIEAAIQTMEQMIDEKLGGYANNSIVAPMAEEMKEKYRVAIMEKAAVSRLEDGNN